MKTPLLTALFVSATTLALFLCRVDRLVGPFQSLVNERSQPVLDWPPELDQRYPDLNLIDQEGNETKLSDFEGQIILLEPIGMPCQACQAFCGGHTRGGFQGVQPQPGLPSMTQAARDYGGFDLSDERIVKVYLLLYNMRMKAPTPLAATVTAGGENVFDFELTPAQP